MYKDFKITTAPVKCTFFLWNECLVTEIPQIKQIWKIKQENM